MLELHDIVEIGYRGGHVYHLRFDDGLEGDADFSEYIGRGPVFEGFANPAVVRNARIEAGTIAWPNGVDIAPETLYDQVRGVVVPATGGGRADRPREGREE